MGCGYIGRDSDENLGAKQKPWQATEDFLSDFLPLTFRSSPLAFFISYFFLNGLPILQTFMGYSTCGHVK